MSNRLDADPYSVADYNVTVHRGFVREDGLMLWGKNPRMKGGLEWRTRKAYYKNVQQKRKTRKVRYEETKDRINAIKLEKGCSICGWGKHKFASKWKEHVVSLLEFDHIDPSTKLYNVCDIKNYAWDNIQAEIDKCRVLCKPCHAKWTGQQNKAGVL